MPGCSGWGCARGAQEAQSAALLQLLLRTVQLAAVYVHILLPCNLFIRGCFSFLMYIGHSFWRWWIFSTFSHAMFRGISNKYAYIVFCKTFYAY